MNRDLVGCSTESACGVGLANRQDAQIMCECTNGVNYMCGQDEVVNVNVEESNNKEKILSRDLLWNKKHSTNRRNKNRIRRSLLRRIHAVKLKEGLSEAKRKQKLERLTQTLALYPKRQKARQLKEGGQLLVHEKQNKAMSQVNRKTSGRGLMGIRYPRCTSNTKVCTKSKTKTASSNTEQDEGRGAAEILGNHTAERSDK